MRTIVIGIGNPVLCDDSVGLEIVRRLRKELPESDDVATTELYAGGIRLMEAMVGYDEAILVDAIQTENGRPGAIHALDLADVAQTRNICSTHDGSLAVALDLGRITGLAIPPRISIWAVEAADVETFSEAMTAAVAAAVPEVVDRIIAQLQTGSFLYQEIRHENSSLFL